MRPVFLVLTVLFWSINAPYAGGIGLGWFSGLILDIFQGPVLGQHAMALALVTYITSPRAPENPLEALFQQSLIVLVALASYEAVVFAIDGWTGPSPLTSPLRWIHAVTGALVWAPVAAVLSHGQRRHS